jgi:hypothetical protein
MKKVDGFAELDAIYQPPAQDNRAENAELFLRAMYANVQDVAKRQEIIKLYFGEQDDHSFGDC